MKKYIDEREKIIIQYIKNKKVLDLWVWDTSDRFLHKIITDNSKSVIWVELDKNRAKKLKDLWYNIIQWNAENIDLWEKFDVIIAWDLIEHLNNPWLFLENIKKHLNDRWFFIFNTPNAYSINFILRWLFFRWNVKQFPEHVYLFTEDLIANILERYDLKIEKTIYFSHKENNIYSYIIRGGAFFSKKWNENILFVVKF